MDVGLDRLAHVPSVLHRLQARPFGLLAHPASLDRNLVHCSRLLPSLGLRPHIIFGPEHGYGGEAQDMIGVSDAHDPLLGAPIVSLYGESCEQLSPRDEHLRGLDTLLIDLCDVGSRYYTFVWTAVLAMRAAARLGVHTIVLDRPNPLGGAADQVEGRPQAPGFLSFVGLEPLPVRHALTIGEIVAEMAWRNGLPLGPDGAVEVVTTTGWNRHEQADQWDRPFVMPSPNMPTVETVRVYPGGCLIEGTNLSEGRGTTRPFELVGAPWLDGQALAKQLEATGLPGFVARPLTFRPTFHKHAGQICGGVQVHVTHAGRFRPFATYLALITLAHKLAPESFRFRTERYEFVDDIPALDLLVGCSDVRLAIEAGAGVGQVLDLVSEAGGEYQSIHARATQRTWV